MEGLKESGSVDTSVLCDRGRESRVFVTEATVRRVTLSLGRGMMPG